MDNNNFSWDKFNAMPIIGIIRGMSIEDFYSVLPLYIKSGLSTLEITMNTPQVEEMISYVRKHYDKELNVGAGTVCDIKDLEKALEFGAQFIVTPIINESVIEECVSNGIPIFPGALTPSEIYKAWKLGVSVVKFFPAAHMGSNYLKDIMGPFNEVQFLPTGGIDLKIMEDFRKIGVKGFGIGSPLFDKKLIREEKWEELTERFSQFVDVINHR